ncbi:MAG TPA: hypothetical protein VMF59_01615, partial [Bacteroidota bacterium]|nr:hypothetical protein [Bacteroidota bacterium]
PVLRQFDYVVVRANIGGERILLDATDPLRPFDLLPPNVLKVPGLVVREGPHEWVAVNTPRPSVHRGSACIAIRQGGEIEGLVETADEEYAALQKRRDLGHMKPLELAKREFDADRSGLVLDSVRVGGEEDTGGPLYLRARISSSSYAQISGDHIYINPALIDRRTSNPFRAEARTYPVNMPFASRTTTIVTLAVPKGYETKELPSDQNLRLQRDDAVYTRVSRVDGDSIQCVRNLFINQTDYAPGSYADLRRFFERVTALESEPVVLALKPAPVPHVAPEAGSAPPAKSGARSPRKR